MHNIKTLGNQQLGLHHEIIHQKLNNIQITIVEDIENILGKTPSMSFETYTQAENFHNFCKPYREDIQKEKKELFITLMNEQHETQKEITMRQKKMLKEIGIHHPSMRVEKIVKEMGGSYFPMFDYMIRFIKLAKAGKADKRPKSKRIEAPPRLIKTFEKLGTSILTVLANNTGPHEN